MKKFTRKQRITAIVAGIVAVCAISLGTMYATGVFPGQSKGCYEEVNGKRCHNSKCGCHKSIMCNRCDDCYYK